MTLHTTLSANGLLEAHLVSSFCEGNRNLTHREHTTFSETAGQNCGSALPTVDRNGFLLTADHSPGCGTQFAHQENAGHGAIVQSSIDNFGTRPNSLVLCVTKVKPRLRAWAAMNRSLAPIIVPSFFR